MVISLALLVVPTIVCWMIRMINIFMRLQLLVMLIIL